MYNCCLIIVFKQYLKINCYIGKVGSNTYLYVTVATVIASAYDPPNMYFLCLTTDSTCLTSES
jgi:hypothetical protein